MDLSMLVIVQLLGCSMQQQPPLPEKIEGLWQLHQVETKDAGIVEAMDMLLQQYPDCSWGRMTWTFDADHIQAGVDILCPADVPALILPVSTAPGAGSLGPGSPDAIAPPAPAVPAEGDDGPQHEFFGCQVTARVPAIWDTEAGSWKVEDTVKARSRTRGRDADALGVPTSCELTLPMGDYPVARVTRQPWRWEMLTPEGSVYRLKLPDSDRPDFVAALRGMQGAAVKGGTP
jgi:hypothetical protein